MRVRVYDSAANKYYKSEVYAIIDHGCYGRYLVLKPSRNGELLKIVEGCRKEEPDHPANINNITPGIPEDWVCIKGEDLPLLKAKLNERGADIRYLFHGHSWLLNDIGLLSSLLKGNAENLDESGYGDRRACSKLEGWNYVDMQEDVETLMDAYGGFHDSCLVRLNYVSGGKVLSDNHHMMAVDDVRQVTMFIESQCCDGIEMVFEGVTGMNLRPSPDGYDNIIFGATLVLKDEEVYFCDQYKADPTSYDGTWIKAFGLRWRLLPLTD